MNGYIEWTSWFLIYKDKGKKKERFYVNVNNKAFAQYKKEGKKKKSTKENSIFSCTFFEGIVLESINIGSS